jgi:hypothetical protein
MSVAFLAASRFTFAQSIPNPILDEFVQTFKEDDLLNRLFRSVWVLRDILGLSAKDADIEQDTGELQELMQKVRAARNEIIDTVVQKGLPSLPPEALDAANRIMKQLAEYGLEPDSPLGTDLIRSYVIFNQAILLSLGNTLCGIYPFRIWCS